RTAGSFDVAPFGARCPRHRRRSNLAWRSILADRRLRTLARSVAKGAGGVGLGRGSRGGGDRGGGRVEGLAGHLGVERILADRLEKERIGRRRVAARAGEATANRPPWTIGAYDVLRLAEDRLDLGGVRLGGLRRRRGGRLG